MSTHLQTAVKPAPAPSFTPLPASLLQRKCACGGSAGLDGECAECKARRLQRKAANPNGPQEVPGVAEDLRRSPGQPLDPATRASFEPRLSHDFARLQVDRSRELEDEANRVAAEVVANAGEPLSAPARAVAPLALQKQERPETPPSITALPGEVPADPKAEEEKKAAEMWEKLGLELAKYAIAQFGTVPSVAVVYNAIDAFFDLPAVQAVGGIGYTATAAAAIVVNAINIMQSRTEPAGTPPARTEPGVTPPEETMFGFKGTWDFTSPPKDIKVITPIGDLPPSFGGEQAPSGGSTRLAAGERRPLQVQEEEFVLYYVLSRQDEILNPVKRRRQKPARGKKKKKKSKARRKPAPSERRRPPNEWPSFKRRSERASPAHDEPEVADAGRRTSGRPLDPETRDRMERTFGCDFGHVRVHADAASAAAVEALNARAYTVGLDVVFGAGEYRPATAEGLVLLAHELTHVVQQGGAPPVRESSGDARDREPPSSPAGPSAAALRTGPSAIVGAHGSRRALPALLLRRKCACGGSGNECEECRAEARRHRKAASKEDQRPVPAIVDEVLRSPGRPLDERTRAFMELRFGHDFSQVRVHTDAKAAASARAVHALAYAVGRDVVFGAGQYVPGTSEGRRLLAHELTHVVQGHGAVASLDKLEIGPSDTDEERAAEVRGDAAERSGPGTISIPAQGPTMLLQRQQKRPIPTVDIPPDEPSPAELIWLPEFPTDWECHTAIDTETCSDLEDRGGPQVQQIFPKLLNSYVFSCNNTDCYDFDEPWIIVPTESSPFKCGDEVVVCSGGSRTTAKVVDQRPDINDRLGGTNYLVGIDVAEALGVAGKKPFVGAVLSGVEPGYNYLCCPEGQPGYLDLLELTKRYA